MQTARGNTRSGGVDISVCPDAMTQQKLGHGLKTIGADRNVYPTGFCNSLTGTGTATMVVSGAPAAAITNQPALPASTHSLRNATIGSSIAAR
jgi:hypothetical protein